VTLGGRLTGTLVMIAGVGIIASLASIFASVLIPPAKSPSDSVPAPTEDRVARELTGLRDEVAALRRSVSAGQDAPET
jgi:hypothetical protein